MTFDPDAPLPDLHLPVRGLGIADLTLEMAYTSWADSCKDPTPELRECRRPSGHEPPHASGHGDGLRTW